MSVSMRDIAQRVGVSVQVVSKVLHGGRSTVGASAATRQRVTDVAREMGYRPNAASLALRRQRFGSVGMLVGGPEQNIFLPQPLLAGLCDELSARDQACVLVTAGRLDASGVKKQRLLCEQMVDALIISYSTDPTSALLSAVASLPLPVIWLYRELSYNAVMFDEADAAEQLVTHLAAAGHRKITYVDYNAGVKQAQHVRQRLSGAYSAARRLGVTMTAQVDTRVERGDRATHTRGQLRAADRPEAVIVDSSSAARIWLDCARQLGLAVPGDLSIATFDDGGNVSAGDPMITAAIVPHEQVGRAAAQMAMSLADGQAKKLPSQRFKFTLFPGGTTPPCPA